LTAIREFNVSWFASGGQTDYIVHFVSESLEVATKMRDDARQQMQENQGRGHTNIMIAGTSDSEMKVEKLGELLREGHFRFRRGDLAKEILIAHNVPPYRIGWAETGSLAGNAAKEMLGAYKYGAIQPIQTVIEDRLYCTLFDKDMGIDTGDFRLKLQELSLDDVEAEVERVTKLVDFAIITPNEAREELGLDPVEDEEEEMSAEQAQAENATEPGMDQVPDPAATTEKAFGDPSAPKPEPPAPGAGRAPAMLDGEEGPMPKKKSQAEAMNQHYYKGQPLGESGDKGNAGMPTHIGPDGKPAMPSDPGARPNPMHPANMFGQEQKSADSADGAVKVIRDFEKTLRDVVRDGTAAVNDSDTSPTPPGERRPSRRSRRQPHI
jgi:hypothetical protein